MPGSVIRSMLVNLGVFAADNNVRRNVVSNSINYTTASGSLDVGYDTLNPGGTKTYSRDEVATATVLYVSAPVRVDITYSTATAGTFTRPADGHTNIVNQALMLDDAITELVVTNNQSYAVRLNLVQG